MARFRFESGQQVQYYGHSDILAQVADELNNRPQSCLAVNLTSWYNSLYSEPEFSDCRYQEEGEQEEPSTLEDVIDIILSFVSGQNRRVALVAIRIICREAQRQLTIDTSESP